MSRLNQSFPRLIGKQFIDFWPYYIVAIGAMFFTHYFQSELPFYAKELGDLVVAGKASEAPFHIYILVALGIIFFRTLSRTLFFYPARIFQGLLMGELVEKLEETHPFRYQDYSPGQLYQRLQVDIQNLRGFVGFALLQVGNVIIAFAILIPKIIKFNDKLIIAFTPLFFVVIIFAGIMAYTQRFFRKIQDYQGDVQNFLIESYEGKKTIKNFHSELAFFKLFKDFYERELSVFFKATFGPATSIPMIKLGVGASFIWGALIVQEEGLGATSLILFSGFVFLLLSPLLFISWIGAVASRSWGSWQRLKELLADIDKESDQEKRIKELNYYGGEEIVVPFWNRTVSIQLEPGKVLALVGDTGVGKSFILDQLGSYYLNLGKNLSYVFQEPYLYNDTLQANLFLGKEPSAEDLEEAMKLLKIFSLDILESETGNIFEIELGENGKRVSGGQAKRIALIRSLLSNAEVYLWDDPFSSVDLILESQIFKELQRQGVFKNKILVLTSHRLSTVKYSDYVLHLDKKHEQEFNLTDKALEEGTKTYEFFKKQMV